MSLRMITLILSLGLSLNAFAESCRHGEGGGGWGEPRGGGWGGRHGGGRHSSWQIPVEEARRLNPIPISGESLARGWEVYEINCLRCHGEAGFGDGPDAASLKVRPAFLRRAAHHHSDGELAWMIRKGRDPMPSWEGTLSEEQIWDVINYIRFDIGGRHGHGQGGHGGKRRGCEGDREACPRAQANRLKGKDCDHRRFDSDRDDCPHAEGYRQKGQGCERCDYDDTDNEERSE